MEESERKDNAATMNKYLAMISAINEIEKRMGWSDLIYLSMNIAVFFLTAYFASLRRGMFFTFTDLLFVLLGLVIGMAICVYWTVSATRLQLKLKLRYFQARFLERTMNCIGECMCSDESLFFDPDIRRLESPDNKETLMYPTSGLARMDGFIGSIKPRYFSWLMPMLFFAIYWVAFVWIIINVN